MAGQKKISALPVATELGDADLIAIVQEGANKALPGSVINIAIQEAKDHAEEVLENFEPESFPKIIDFVKPTSDYEVKKQFGNDTIFNSDKQIVTLSAGYEYLHGSCIAGGYIFYGCRKSAGLPGHIIRFNLEDLTDQSTLVLGGDATYNGTEQLTYVPEKGKIYVAHNNAGNDLYITEIDPFSTPMTATRVVSDLAIGYRMYYPPCTSDGTFLYVVSGLMTTGATLKIRKYNLAADAPYPLVDVLDTGIVAGGHAMKYDGHGQLFVTTSYRNHENVQQYVLRIDLSTFTLQDQGALTGESYTDDMTIVGDWVYMGMEYIYTPTNGKLTIARAKKKALSTVEYLTIPTIQGSIYGMVYDGYKYLYCLAATTPGNILRIDPETLIVDVYTTPTGEEIPNEYLFSGTKHYISYWKSPAVVASYSKIQYQQRLLLSPAEGIVGDTRIAPIQILKADLNTLITNSALIPGKQYIVTDSANGGSIIVTASTTSKLKNSAEWLRMTDIRSFGWIRLTGGGSGSVDTLTVNAVNQMSSSVAYTTSLANTASLVAANINANGSATYTAIAMLDVIVLVAKTALASLNALTVAATSTTITTGSIQNTVRGLDPVLYPLEIKYDAVLDVIWSCYDPVLNNRIECSKSYIAYANTTLGAKPILEFRWGDAAFIDTRVKKGYIKDVYIAGDGLFEANTLEDYSFIRNIIGTSSSYFGINSCYGAEAVVRNNCMIGTFTQIIRNEVKGPITNNMLSGSQSSIGANFICVKTDATYIISGITGNTLSGLHSQIAYNTLNSSFQTGSHTKISNNVLSGSNTLIWGNVLIGESCFIDQNILSASSARIRKNRLTGGASYIFANTISGGSQPGIYDNTFNGFASGLVSNNIVSTDNSSHGIINCTFNGTNSNITGCTVDNSGNIGSLVMDMAGASLNGFTTTALIPKVENMHWKANKTLEVRYTKTGLNGATNNGLAASPIYMGIVPASAAFPMYGVIEGKAITVGGGGRLTIGVETDDPQNFIIDSATSAFNNAVVAGIPTLTKSTALNRAVVITPTVADITAGSFEITYTLGLSSL